MDERHSVHPLRTPLLRSCARAFAGSMLALCVFVAHAEPVPGDDARVRDARAAALELGAKLKAQLEAAIAAGGPSAALEICRSVAPALAGEASARYAGEVGRTALRIRNPANVPDDYERAVLEGFVAQAAAGADVASLEHAEVVEQQGRQVFRYMKAIPMAAAPCGSCHGTELDPALRAKIRERYPSDTATGFIPGEIRGAFTVAKELP